MIKQLDAEANKQGVKVLSHQSDLTTADNRTIIVLTRDEVCPSAPAAGCYVKFTSAEEGKSVTGYLAASGFDKDVVIPILEKVSRVVINAGSPLVLNLWVKLNDSTRESVRQCCAAMAKNGPPSTMSESAKIDFALETVRGSALLAQHANRHFGSLKDSVTMPGGMTIRGLKCLRSNGFQGAIMSEVIANAKSA